MVLLERLMVMVLFTRIIVAQFDDRGVGGGAVVKMVIGC